MKSLFEQLGGTYTRQGDYCLPDVCLPPEEERPIGIYGQRRHTFLREHHRALYYNLLTAGVLDGHIADIEEQAENLMDDGQISPSEYAEDKIRYAAEDVTDLV